MLYLVKFLDTHGDVNGFNCIVFAKNKDELFWHINKHGSSMRCEITPFTKSFSLGCMSVWVDEEDDLHEYHELHGEEYVKLTDGQLGSDLDIYDFVMVGTSDLRSLDKSSIHKKLKH